jgi:DNA invertase Pin-like site-specific DNA recombinase
MKRREPSREPRAQGTRAAIYTRKSTSAGLDQAFNSLDAQRESCEAYVHRQDGWVLLPTRYDDGGFTGANIERPAFQLLMADVDGGKVDVVVVYKVDRLSRSLLDFATVMHRLNAGRAAFVSVTQNFSTADAMGRLTLNMLMSFAEFEREMISARTRDKIAASRRKGMWTGGIAPVGYRIENKKLVVDALLAPIIPEIFELFETHRSLRAVARALRDRPRLTRGYRAYRGGGRGRATRPWSDNDVVRVLTSPVYAGLIASGQELYPGAHTALVDRETWDRVQKLLTRESVAPQGRSRAPQYFLAGLVQCGGCGAALAPHSARGRQHMYRYYRCTRAIKEGRGACSARTLPAVELEAYVLQHVRGAIADGDLAGSLTRALETRVATRRSQLLAERQALNTRLESLAAQAARLDGDLTELSRGGRALGQARLASIAEERDGCRAGLAAGEIERDRLARVQIEGTWVTQMLGDFERSWELLTPDNRVRLVRAIVERVEVDQAANVVRIALVDLHEGAAETTTAGPSGGETT